jgi:hypothetical protein
MPNPSSALGGQTFGGRAADVPATAGDQRHAAAQAGLDRGSHASAYEGARCSRRTFAR